MGDEKVVIRLISRRSRKADPAFLAKSRLISSFLGCVTFFLSLVASLALVLSSACLLSCLDLSYVQAKSVWGPTQHLGSPTQETSAVLQSIALKIEA